MIISRTPYRISFLGGGTDYPTWYQEYGSEILATTINHYCYLTCRSLPPFFQHKSTVVWSKVEQVSDHGEIDHPAVRAILKYLNIEHGVEIHHQGDLPARSGLGSSSAFTVGLLNAIYALRGEISSKRELACEAVHIERDLMKESVGVQDQIETAFGGLNKITVYPSGDFKVEPLVLPMGRSQQLQDHLLLFFTGVSRTASHIAEEKIKAIPNRKAELQAMQSLVEQGIQILCRGNDLNDFGHLLHETWQLKRQLVSQISPTFVDEIYARARHAGALGGKLLGAGGGGFMLFFVKPEDQPRVLEALKDLLLVPFKFENNGTQIILYDNLQYSQTSMYRRDYQHLIRHRPSRLMKKEELYERENAAVG